MSDSIELDNVDSKQATTEYDNPTVKDIAEKITVMGKKSKKEEKKPTPPKASIREIFTFATPIDCGLMLIGILAAVAMGTALPLAMLLFGDVTNTFINYQVSRSTVELLSNNNIVLDSFNDSNTIYFTSIPETFNCSQLQPIVQYYYTTIEYYDIDCLTNDQFYMEAMNDTIQLELVINDINCTIFQDIFTDLYGNIAECLDKDRFIDVIDSQIIYFIIIAFGAFFLGFVMLSTFHLASERQVYKMRLAYYKAVLRQDIAWFDLNPTGELSSRLSDDLDKVLSGIGDKLALLFQWISTFFTGFAIGFVRDWRLTLVLLGLTPFLAIGGALISWVTTHFTSRGQQSYAQAGAIAEEVLSSIKTVIAFGGEYKESQRYDKEIKAGRIVGAKKGVSVGLSIGYVFFLLFLSYAVAFWFGGWLVSEDYAQGGEILTVFFSVLVGAFAIGQAAPNLESFGAALGAGGTIIRTIKRTPPIDSYSNDGINPGIDDPKIDNSIQFNNVSFNYPARPDIEVLKSLSLSVSNSKTIALVGHSGCGKSTILQLIQRFYDVNNGQILIGDHPINDININYLRSMIGVVSQEPVLFDLTILDNIKFGNDNATMEEIYQAAKDANIHDFIKELPQGYDTLVGERGAQLSGGQKQRVAIARALVRNPRILLLDEATSALDSESERLVQSALEKAREGRTTIIIAHRLSTIQNADRIFVLENGSIVETGCHGDLMKQQGYYYDMVMAQSKTGIDEAFINITNNKLQDTKLMRQLSHQYSRQPSQKGNKEITQKLTKDEILKKKQAEWDKELSSVPITRVMALNGKEWYLITLGTLGAAINGSIFPLFAIIFGELLQAFSKSDDEVLDAIYLPAGLFVVLAVVSAIAIFTKTVCFILSGELLTERIRARVFKAMLRQEMGWFDEEKHSTGALTTRLSEDAAQVQGATGSRLGTLVETFVGLLLSLAIAFAYSWIITIVVLGFAPLLVLATTLKTILLTKHATKNKKSQTEAGKLAVDSIENIRTVTPLNLQLTFVTIYENEIRKPYRTGLLLGLLEGVAYGISQGMIFFGYVIAFRFGAFVVSLNSDHILYTEFQNVFRVLFALVFGALAVGQASAFAPNLAKATVSTNRIFSLLDRKPIIDNYSTEGQKFENIYGAISFDNISFNYPSRPDVPVLNELSLTIKPGQTVALVGPSGCGKSTLVSLIERFYDPLQGIVKLDDVSISDINIRWLRTQLGIVNQEPILFDDSIAENIRYGINHGDVSDEQVIEAAIAANIHEFIQSLPQGYNTNVGDKGTQLSGGQKQRVAIARAIIRNPKILLLDEATSALDSESEIIVQEALDKAREGRTSIVIAHRLSTVITADCIVVVTNGKIAEMGNHSELLAQKGIYYQLYQHQQLINE